jgi:hypothetical protein
MAHRVARLLGGTAAVLLATVPAAYAATGSPPVTSPDVVAVHAGEARPVDVTANDKDPDGDQLQVCRLGPLPRALAQSMIQDGTLFVAPSRRAHGTYTLTYYACDDSYLTAGTLTVDVRPPAPTLNLVPVGDAPPGRFRIVNTYKHAAFHCRWHPLDDDTLEGKVVVRARSTAVITVHESAFVLDCVGAHSGYSFGYGG